MKIIIKYESCWRNSFLDGDNNEPLPQKGRKFIGSMTNLRDAKNFKVREITHDTVMGVLNRLIGDQRKLYQSRNDENYFFKDIDDEKSHQVSFSDKPIKTNEMTYIRNISGSEHPSDTAGAIKANDIMFTSEYSDEFWGVLALDINELCDFITNNSPVTKKIQADPIFILNRLELLKKEKPISNEGEIFEARKVLNEKYPSAEYIDAKNNIKPITFYCSALYLQLDRLEKETDYDMSSARTSTGCISGINNSRKPGFTIKDFKGRFSTGGKKKVWGNPYLRKEKVKGIGEVVSLMTKARGQLEINLDISRDKAKEIKSMIEDAGVSSFYLGKKGLAYISQAIDTRELTQ